MGTLPIRILLVDDDEEDFIITSGVVADIEGKAFRIEWRNSYAAAVEAIENGTYDVLIFDFHLGADSGLELLRHVVARGYPAPVILLTGQDDKAVDEEAIRIGAADYLIKGRITPDTFERAVRHAIEQHRTLAELRASNAFLQSIIDANTASIAILDSQGAILTVNQAWRERFGDDAARSVGANYGLWSVEAEPEEIRGRLAFDAGIQAVLEGKSKRFSIDSPLSAAGMCQWVQSSVTSFESLGEIFAVVSHEDITARKLAESMLQESRERLRELSVRDELTGIYNRRYFNSVLGDELARSRRHGREFAVLLLDIDHFKAVNDTYGHHVGDLALRHVAQTAVAGCRTTDFVARYGGEEFVFVLPETNLEAAQQFAERIRKSIQDSPLTLPGSANAEILLLTASLGIAMYPAADAASSLLELADKGLYLAKRQGRNRVCFAGE